MLKFAISPLGYYFSENTIVIAETTAVETPEPDKPWAGDGASTSGCDAGFAALALLALIPLGLRRKR
ncbi:MAG: Synerg-CTERM sorting domain-containing protein [Cloacibacillus evryensis]